LTRPSIWVGDVGHALAALRPEDDTTLAAIARLLGFQVVMTTSKPKQVTPLAPVADKPVADEPVSERDQQPHYERGDEASAEAAPLAGRRWSRILDPVSHEPAQLAGRWARAASLERVTSTHLEAVPPHQTLFPPQASAAMIVAAVATAAGDGPPDVERAVETLASRKPLDRLPQLPRRSLFRGVQLLVDIGEAMEPFARDGDELADQIRAVVGRNQVAELRFCDCPLREVGDGPVWTWGPYRPPDPGTPVLVVTDLGIGGPLYYPQRSRTEEWLTFAELLHRRVSPLVAFVPYPPDRWPPTLARVMTVVQWDRATTITAIQAAIKKARVTRP
jgi:hypothetical protein